MNATGEQHRAILQRIARRVMVERGLFPDFSAEALSELGRIQPSATTDGGQIRDLRDLLWASIDNDDSRDLDQLTVAEAMSGNKIKLLVAVADVDSVVTKGSAIDEHARHNTTSVYTAATIFPMLPEKLSTDITSLGFNVDRLTLVAEMVVGADGSLQNSDIYRACVRNRAKLAYDSVAAWLEGRTAPAAVAAVPGLDENLRLQDRAAQRMKTLRQVHGALSFDSREARPIFDGDTICGLEAEKPNRAKDLIADFMIAANGVTARYLSSKQFPSLRRVVRTPKRWDRIVELARQHGFKLPDEPDPRPLNEFLVKARAADPLRFPDLSLSVIKLMGPGEYVAECPGDATPPGALWACGRGLYPFHGPQPPLSGYCHPTAAEGCPGWASRPLRQRRPGVVGKALHGRGGCREEGRTAGREVGSGDAAGVENRGKIRRHRHRCSRQGYLGSHPESACGRKAGARCRGHRRGE
jgi:exoribonuclease-2